MSHAARRGVTLAEFFAIPAHERFHELLGDELVEKAAPSGEHGDAQAGVVSAVRPPYQRRGGPGGPGGWWIPTEVETKLPDGAIVRPDVLGWRRERCPERPTGTPVEVLPDWVCEVVSESNANVDTVKKLRLYHAAAVPHYWIVDPRDATLTVLQHAPEGYITVRRAERGEVVRPPPFDAVELPVGVLFGDDPPE